MSFRSHELDVDCPYCQTRIATSMDLAYAVDHGFIDADFDEKQVLECDADDGGCGGMFAVLIEREVRYTVNQASCATAPPLFS